MPPKVGMATIRGDLRIIGATALMLLGFVLAGGPGADAASTPAQVDTARTKGLAWLLTHQRADGSWASKAGTEVAATALAVEALVKAAVKGRPFLAAVSWLSNAEPASTDSLARKAIALKGAGVTVTPHLDTLVAWRNRSLAWGAYTLFDASSPDTALALGALRVGGYTYPSATYQTGLCVILEARNKTTSPQDLTVYGSWGFGTTPPTTATAAAALPTALNLLETDTLAKAQNWFSVSCWSGSQIIYDVKNDGVNWLLANRRHATDGGFGEPLNGPVVSTVLDTAVVYEVLKAFRPTATATRAALDYLVTHQQADGSWNGDPLQTALVLRALLAAPGVDADSDGLPDPVEAALRTNPSVPDARGPPAGTGTNAPIALTPSRATAGGTAFTLTVTGSNFLSTSVVQWNGANRTTTFVDATTLQASIAAADIATVGTAQVAVNTPSPGGGLSNTLPFTISAIPLLSLAKAGTDVGTVTSSPAGIACGATCASLFPPGTQVTLTATPATGATFTGWSGGGCTGTAPCTLTLAADTLITAAFDPAAYASWWNPRWQYRKTLTVTAQGDALQAGYSLPVQFNHASLVSGGKSAPSGDDVRVTYFDGTTEWDLDRVLDRTSAWDSSTTKLWFKLQAAIATPTGSDANYFLYYGNPAAEAPPADPNNVWVLWEGFNEGPLDTTKWTVMLNGATGVNVVTTGGELKIYTPYNVSLDPNITVGISSVTPFDGNFSVESRIRVASYISSTTWKATFGLGSDSNGLAVSSTPTQGRRVQYFNGTMWADVGPSNLSAVPPGSYVQQTLLLTGTGTHFDGQSTGPVSRTGLSTSPRALSFQYGPGTSTSGSFSVYFDNIAVRKYVASDAALASSGVILGATEQVAGGTRPTTTLGVRLPSSTGTGTVTSSPPGIACGATCVAPFDTGTTITLTAAPGPAATVTWTGCSSVNGNTCTVTGLSVNKWIVATFSATQYVLSVTRAGTGSGTVTSTAPVPPGTITCGAVCAALFSANTAVTLSAAPDAGSLFAGWSGNCSAGGTVTMSAPKTCTATFTAAEIVMDNSQPGTSLTGVWLPLGAPTTYGPNAVANKGTGTHTYRWTPTIPITTTYLVYLWWPAAPSRSSTVSVTVKYATGPSTYTTFSMTVDQQRGGGQWRLVGTDAFQFNAGSTSNQYVEVGITVPGGSPTPDGWAAADAVRFIPAGSPTLTITKAGTGLGAISSTPPGIRCGPVCVAVPFATGVPVALTALPDPGSTFAGWSGDGDCADGVAVMSAARACTATFTSETTPIVIDNDQAETGFTGTWNVATGSGSYGPNNRVSAGAGTYRFAPSFPGTLPRTYAVYVWWTAASSRHTAVPLRVLFPGGSQPFTVNQREEGGDWHLLGTFTFNPGSSLTQGAVEIDGGVGQEASADAVRFVPLQ